MRPLDVGKSTTLLATRQEGDSPGHRGCRSSFLELPARSFLRARDHKSGKGPWKLPEP
jgi:hypothetical protein